jgi:hypothetical protein
MRFSSMRSLHFSRFGKMSAANMKPALGCATYPPVVFVGNETHLFTAQAGVQLCTEFKTRVREDRLSKARVCPT